eukprot:302087_1
MNCGGDRSCANAELRTHGAIEARGSYALYNATIHSTADGFYVSLVGSNAGFGARIFCHLGHSCTIYCAATGCKMLYIDCAGNCDIQTNSIDTHHPITDYSLFDALPSNISDSRTTPDDWCDDTIDDFYERPSTIISSVRVCCRGSNSCQESAIKSHLVTVCSGAHSCHGSDEIAAVNVILCSANNACSNSTLVSSIVYCLGMYACKNAQISASVLLYCSGYKSCEGSTIIDTETIHFIGASSGYGAGIDCTGIGSCNIICDAYNSCGYISSFHCNGIGGCTVSCNHDTGCPPGYTPLSVAPTSTPSYSPTTSGCIALHPTMKAINVAMSANNITFIHNVPRAEQIDGSDIATFSSQSLYLNVTQSELHCGGLVSCFQSKIYCASEQIHCNVLCKGQLSCIEATIHANNTQNIHVMCDGEDACRNVQIYTHNITAVTIDCVSSSSCTAMQISLNKNTQSIISCYLMNSCDDIHIFSTNYNDTQLYLYEYSENIVYDNGYGLEGIHCGTESQYVRYETSLTDTDIRSLIESEYNGPLFPCDKNIQIKCDQNMTDNVMNECTVDYVIEPATAGLLPSQCYWISIVDLVTIRCLGSCVTSPTEAPTYRPSSGPTQDTIDPTMTPTAPPSNAPSSAPSASPVNHPTLSPTSAPSHVPSESPINSPTTSPSNAPSNAPSESPTSRPTLNPLAIHEFDYYIDITFVLDAVNDENKNQITTNPINETMEIETIIKNTYVGDATHVAYSDLLIEIESIEGSPIESIDQATNTEWTNMQRLNLQSSVQCTEFGCASIIKQSQIENDFAASVQYILRQHFDNDELLFSVGQSLKIIDKNEHAPEDHTKLYIFYGMSSIVCILVLIAIFAFLFNIGMFPQLPGFFVVDDAQWTALLIFSLQFWDFYSDVNLAGEIWNHDARGDNMLLLVSAIGATFFVIVPYIANLVIAANIKHIIRKNQAAKSWFQYNTFIFTILVVVTGGSFPALALVSSGIFGMAIFTCGLTQYELKRMSKMKVLGTVVIENVPQLFCQAMYAYAIKEITPGVQLAFIASLLSVTASTLSYLIDRDTSDTEIVHYYLSMVCERRKYVDNDEGMDLEENTNTQIELQHMHMGSTTLTNQTNIIPDLEDDDESETETQGNVLTKDEKQNIIDNRGRTWCLGGRIAEVFRIPPKNIEVGFSQITRDGLMTHIVHYVDREDIEIMQQELDNVQGDEAKTVTPSYFTKQLHLSLHQDISAVFRKHFHLNKDFIVEYSQRLGVAKKSMVNLFAKEYGDVVVNDNKEDIERKQIVTQMVRRITATQLPDDQKETNCKLMLNKIFDQYDAKTQNERMDLLSKLMKSGDVIMENKQ